MLKWASLGKFGTHYLDEKLTSIPRQAGGIGRRGRGGGLAGSGNWVGW